MSAARRQILERLADGPVPGPTVATDLGISRAAVWKHIEALRSDGFEIESTPDGYRIRAIPPFGQWSLEFGLQAPYSIEYHERIESTNDRARELAYAGERDIAIVANEQTKGRGRRDRKWIGSSGGIYVSILVQPALEPQAMSLVTLAGAVATADALAEFDASVGIKWPNDVLIEGEKVAGILTEMEAEADRTNWVIVGIGINANQPHETVPDGATTVQAMIGEPVERRTIVHTLLETFANHLESPSGIRDAWLARAETIGSMVRVHMDEKPIVGTAVDITETGSLRVETASGIHTVHSGDCIHLDTLAD